MLELFFGVSDEEEDDDDDGGAALNSVRAVENDRSGAVLLASVRSCEIIGVCE